MGYIRQREDSPIEITSSTFISIAQARFAGTSTAQKQSSSNPLYNTQAGEQTFVWAARLKHNVCSMTKEHHFFYLHRKVVHRNGYTAKCHQQGKEPILPKK